MPVAYLCVGYPARPGDRPELERAGWRRSEPLAAVVNFEAWGRTTHPRWRPLRRLVGRDRRDYAGSAGCPPAAREGSGRLEA